MYTDPTGSVEVDFQLVLDFDRFNTGVIQPNVIPLFNNTSNFSRYGSPSATYGTATYGSGNVDNILETQIIGSGYNASITLTSDDVNPPFSLDAVVLEYAVNGRR